MYKCAEGIICLNNLNLPSYDLHFTEGMDQALANLAQLELSFQNMSEKINEKTAKQKAKIEELFQRISKCNQRVEQLSGEKIALFFTSPSRYVRSYKFQPENNVSIFKEFLVRPPIKQFDNKTRYEMEHNITKMGKESKVALDSLNNMVEMLYVNLKPKRKGAFEAMNRIKEEGLGNLPNDIKYLDSLLVFNSNINPYRRYQLIDNQKVEIVHKVKAKEVQDAIAIEKAPEYMNMTIDKLEVNNHGFVPMDKTIDFIDFQDDLDFDNIVSIDDIFAESIDSVSYNPTNKAAKKQVQTVETRREPKVETQKSAPAQTQAPVPSKAPPQQMTQSTTLPPPPSMPHSSSLPPPPPPPSLSSSLPLPPPPPSIGLPLPPPIGLPPPPGPPPSIGLPPPPPPSMPSAPSAPPIALNGANARSKLLGQIQNRGNIKLKKTVTREYVPGQSNAPRERSPPPAGGSSQGGEPPKKEMNHMDLLRNRLKVRYQAINPKANDDGQKTEQ